MARDDSEPSTGRVLVVDDHAEIRLLVRTRLEMEPQLEVVGEAANGAEAVTLAASLAPDVVVLDREMPVMRADEAIPQIRKAVPGIRILLYTAASTKQASPLPPASQVDSVLQKGTPLDRLVEEVRDLAKMAGHDVLRIVLKTVPLEVATTAFDVWAGANVRILEALARKEDLPRERLGGVTAEELAAVVGVYAHFGDNLRKAVREQVSEVTPIIHMLRSTAAAARRGLMALNEMDLASFYEVWNLKIPDAAMTHIGYLRSELIAVLPASSADTDEGGEYSSLVSKGVAGSASPI